MRVENFTNYHSIGQIKIYVMLHTMKHRAVGSRLNLQHLFSHLPEGVRRRGSPSMFN